jgi:hypothetical protein
LSPPDGFIGNPKEKGTCTGAALRAGSERGIATTKRVDITHATIQASDEPVYLRLKGGLRDGGTPKTGNAWCHWLVQ